MNINTWRRTPFEDGSGDVEIAPDDWTLLDPSGRPMTCILAATPAVTPPTLSSMTSVHLLDLRQFLTNFENTYPRILFERRKPMQQVPNCEVVRTKSG